MKAILNKQTEKAVNLTFGCQVYESHVTVKNVWIPKSQIDIITTEGDIIEFTAKNEWIITSKVKEYFKMLQEKGYSINSDIKLFLSPIDSCIITNVYA